MFAGCTTQGANVYDGKTMTFECPKGWEITKTNDTVEFEDVEIINSTNNESSVSITAYKNDTIEDVEESWKSLFNILKQTRVFNQATGALEEKQLYNITRTTKTIAGVNCIIYTLDEIDDPNVMYVCIFQKNGNAFDIVWGENVDNGEEIVKHIIETLTVKK